MFILPGIKWHSYMQMWLLMEACVCVSLGSVGMGGMEGVEARL